MLRPADSALIWVKSQPSRTTQNPNDVPIANRRKLLARGSAAAWANGEQLLLMLIGLRVKRAVTPATPSHRTGTAGPGNPADRYRRHDRWHEATRSAIIARTPRRLTAPGSFGGMRLAPARFGAPSLGLLLGGRTRRDPA